MKNGKDKSARASELRRLAEQRLRKQKQKTKAVRPETAQDTLRLVHELQVHQIELEMQNEASVQARAEVEAALEKYTELYDFAPVGYVTLGRDGTIRKLNLLGANLLGIPRQRVQNRRFGHLVSDESRPAFEAFFQKVFEGQAKEACEIALARKGNEPLVVRIEAVAGQDGQECRAVMIDITARKEAEEALRQSEDNFRTLVEAAPEAIFVQSQGRFIYLNPAMLALLGASRSEGLLGTNFFDRVAPGYHQAVRENFRLRKIGQPADLLDREYLRLDGSRVPVETAVVNIMYQGREASLVFVRDATARQLAQQALAESEQRFRTLFEQATEGILLANPATMTFHLANPQMGKMLGYSPEELAHLSVRDIHPKEALPFVLEDFEKQVQGKIAGTADVPVKRKDGCVFYADIRTFPVNVDGEVYLAGLFRDATDRRTAAEQSAWHQTRLQSLALESSLAEERERRRLASNLHDDILQILALVQIKLPVLAKTKAATDRDPLLEEITGLVTRSVNSCRSLTLQLSHPALYDLGFMAAAQWLAEDLKALHGLKVTLKDDGRPKPLDEPIRVVLFQCLRELLVNVAKHARVAIAQVHVTRHDSIVRVTIRDKGVGFKPSVVNYHSRDHFGLFSIRERLSHLGGHMDIRSAPGQGTTVTLTVPMSVAPAGAVEDKS